MISSGAAQQKGGADPCSVHNPLKSPAINQLVPHRLDERQHLFPCALIKVGLALQLGNVIDCGLAEAGRKDRDRRGEINSHGLMLVVV
jgi:hypothetical protein